MEEVLTPLKASALYVGMTWLPPLYFFGAMGVDEGTVASFQRVLERALREPAFAE